MLLKMNLITNGKAAVCVRHSFQSVGSALQLEMPSALSSVLHLAGLRPSAYMKTVLEHRKESADAVQDAGVHRLSHTSCLRVLLAGMVHTEEARQVVSNDAFGAMREAKSGPQGDLPALFQNFKISVPCDFSKRQDCSWPQDIQFVFQVRSTTQDFAAQWLVCRRGAAYRRGDIDIREAQAIISVYGSGLIRESGFMQSFKQEIGGAVASEDAACAISAVRCRSQPENKKFGIRIAEAGDTAAPVSPFAEGSPSFPRHFFAIFHQARAFTARAYLFLDHPQALFRGHCFPFKAPAIITAWFCFSSLRP